MSNTPVSQKKGFTLIELLIVIGILAVLATTAVIILNPAQLLAQARDSQRLSDLRSIEAALALFMTDVNPVELGACSVAVGTVARTEGAAPTNGSFISAGPSTIGTRVVSGAGWVDVDFTDISGGSPLPNLPVDPTNTGDFRYRYACEDATNSLAPNFELNACLESTKYDDLMGTDGGDKNTVGACGTVGYYEVGTLLTL